MAKRIASLIGLPPLGAVGMALALTMMLLTAVTTKAQTYSVLYSFTGGADGGYPAASLILDKAGNLYGTTSLGGLSNCFFGGCGVVFKVNSSTGDETVLYSFCPGGGSCTDGSSPGFVLGNGTFFLAPNAALIADAAGNLYGTTWGNVFKIDTTGAQTVLHNFTGYPTDGPSRKPVWSAARPETFMALLS